jgi:hypothetical protein
VQFDRWDKKLLAVSKIFTDAEGEFALAGRNGDKVWPPLQALPPRRPHANSWASQARPFTKSPTPYGSKVTFTEVNPEITMSIPFW